MKIKVDHIGIMANHLNQSVRFYEDCLGFEAVNRGETKDGKQIVFLRHSECPDLKLELIKENQSKHMYSETGLVNHLAFAVDNIDHSIEMLKDKGVTFLAEQTKMGIGRRTIRFKGPSGEILQLVEDEDLL